MNSRYRAVSLSALLLFAFPWVSAANTILSNWTWSDSVASGLVTGTAQFSVAPDGPGFDLVIVVNNTSPVVPTTTAQILTGLFFDINPHAGPLTMAAASATGGLLSSVNQSTPDAGSADTNICAPGHGGSASDPTCPVTLGGGWEAAYDALGLGGGTFVSRWGIGTAGFGIFNGNSSTGTGNANYGIAPGSSVGIGSADGLPTMVPYVSGVATFKLTGLTSDQIAVMNVFAAYGTGPEGVEMAFDFDAPEPGTWAMLAGGGLLLIMARRRRQSE